MRFFLINLDRDEDRLAYMNTELAKLGVEAERIPACLGLEMPGTLKSYFLDEAGEIGSAMNKGEVGCYASHLYVMHRILAETITEPVLVMEDDLHFEETFQALLQAMEQMPKDWEIIRLSNPSKAAYRTVGQVSGLGEIVKYWRVPNNTGAYIINKAGAEKFLSYHGCRKRPVDEDLRRPWEHGVVTYGIVPAPITSNIFDSTIDEIGAKRALPGRKRFKDAKSSLSAEWLYRLREFGLVGSLAAMTTTLIFKKRIRNKSRIQSKS